MVEVGSVGDSGRPVSRRFTRFRQSLGPQPSNHLIQTNGTTGALHSAAYGIRWSHHMAGFPSTLDDPFVALVLQGCERLCAQPTTKKDPVAVSVVKELVDHYGPTANSRTYVFSGSLSSWSSVSPGFSA